MLSRWNLPLRNLWYFGLANGLIVLGVMIGTAVLTGALLLGDSLKGSLTQQTLDRLGHIDAALMSEQFFPASLWQRLSAKRTIFKDMAPAIILRGTVLRRDLQDNKLLARAGQVQVVGVNSFFWYLFGEWVGEPPPSPLYEQESGWAENDSVLINQALADALQVQVEKDGLEIRIEKPQAVPAESLLGKRNEEAALVVETSRLAGVIPNRGAGRFTLQPRQDEPLIIYVHLERLQRRLTRDQQLPAGSVNTLLAMTSDEQNPSQLQAALDQVASLEDLGLIVRPDSSKTKFLALETRRLLFQDPMAETIQKACRDAGLQALPLITNLANRTLRITTQEGSETLSKEFVPYSAIVGLDFSTSARFGTLTDPQGHPITDVPEDGILINEFVANDLWPDGKWQDALNKPAIRIEYFQEAPGHQLQEEHHDFKLAGVVALKGLGAEKTLTPDFPGMKGTRIADWDPPFPPEQWHKEWIRPKDEQYYREHRVTPKLFIQRKIAEKLFASRFGTCTSFLIAQSGTPLQEVETKLRAALKSNLKPEDLGLRWQPVKAQGLMAATQGGTTNMFGGLFAGFSLFLILAAALLVGLLFRLRMERRANELGILLATGWSIKQTRRLLIIEGLCLAFVGALVGVPLAIAYTEAMIHLLRTGWGGALGTDTLALHFTTLTLVIGSFGSIIVAFIAIVWSLRGLVKVPMPMLLAGQATAKSFSVGRGWLQYLAILFGVGAVASVIYGMGLPTSEKPEMFFTAGFLSLVAFVLAIRWYLRSRLDHPLFTFGSMRLLRFGEINLIRSLNRSLLTITLLAAGAFMVVAVGAFRKTAQTDATQVNKATGGFDLIAESDIPFLTFPDVTSFIRKQSPEDRAKYLGMNLLTATIATSPEQFVPFRLHRGDDVSCLTLYQPQRPRVLGVPREMPPVGPLALRPVSLMTVPTPFDIMLWPSASETAKKNPWWALEDELPDHAVPIILDDHTAEWVLQKKLGDDIEIPDELGHAVTGRLVGILKNSIFQSEMLISEENFRRLYPSDSGYRFFLISQAPQNVQRARITLETIFGESHGLVVKTTASRMAAYYAIENTYIATFQALGGLGLLLGTAGLGIVILRNVQERKGELALLQAVGFDKRHLRTIILAEVAWMVIGGLLAGCLSALIVIAPMLTSETVLQLLFWLGLVILAVPIVALVAAGAGVRLALHTPLIPALRGE
jgi:ABC-type lipoprotein release transport system permease subunit